MVLKKKWRGFALPGENLHTWIAEMQLFLNNYNISITTVAITAAAA